MVTMIQSAGLTGIQGCRVVCECDLSSGLPRFDIVGLPDAAVREAYDRAVEILRANIDKLHFIAKFLVDHETMDDAQFAAVMEGEPTVEELEEMTAERERISREENDRRRAELLGNPEYKAVLDKYADK